MAECDTCNRVANMGCLTLLFIAVFGICAILGLEEITHKIDSLAQRSCATAAKEK